MRISRYIICITLVYGASGQCLCSSELLGDGECQAECYTEDCNWDSNDCLDQQCELGCLNSMVGDTVCQETCFNAACSYDGSDCTKCTDTCAEFQLGDGVCQTDCFNKDCNWDSEDCGTQCATGCELSYLGNGICEQACNNAVCLYDESDCIDLCSSSGCDSTNLGDGICDTECNNSLCKYDSGDCTPLRYFSTVYTLTSTTEEEEEYEPENFGKVGGLGLGVVLTIAAILVGVLLCIVGAATPYWIMFFIMGILIPVIVFLVVALAPTKRDVKDEDDDRTDDSIVPRYIILAMLVVSTLLGGLRIMEYYLAINVKARRVDSRINSGPAESELLLVNAGSPQHTSPNNQNLELEEEIPRGFPKLRELEMEEFSPFTSDSISGRPRKYPV